MEAAEAASGMQLSAVEVQRSGVVQWSIFASAVEAGAALLQRLFIVKVEYSTE